MPSKDYAGLIIAMIVKLLRIDLTFAHSQETKIPQPIGSKVLEA